MAIKPLGYLYVFDENGKPELAGDVTSWTEFFASGNKRRLAWYEGGPVCVSTVFLGIDHSFGREGPPVLWETLVRGGEHDGYQERYSSRADALVGHDLAVKMVRGPAKNP